MTLRLSGEQISGRRLLNPAGPFIGLVRHARLILDLIRRDVHGRYKGAIGGRLWAFMTPLLMLAIYSFVFGYIFKSRWTAAETGNVNFSIVLFVGLIFSNFLSDCLNRAPGLVVSNPNYVKKVVFPLEVLPWVAIGSSLFHAAISVLVLILAMATVGVSVPLTILLLPLVFLLFAPMVAGITWFFAAIGVFLRDLQQFVVVFSTALVFLAPIFYPRTMLPEHYRWVMSLNPLTFVVEAARDLVLWGRLPDLTATGVYAVMSLMVGWLGWAVFQTTKKGFADVL